MVPVMAIRIAVAGTGTGVGKTHVSIALLRALAHRGHPASGLKPIETGVCSGVTDAALLSRASSVAPLHSPYAFTDPVSPHLASRRANVAISLDVVAAWVDQHQASVLVIETAGGLLSPLAVGVTNLDLIRAVSPHLIWLVTVDQLGVLHNVNACIIALQALFPGHPPVACLLQAPETPDSSSGTNNDELRRLEIAPLTIAFPRASPSDPATEAAAAEALNLLPLV